MARNGLTELSSSGNTKNLDAFFKRVTEENFVSMLRRYGEKGVQLLSESTPVDTGVTAASWTYNLVKTKTGYKLYWNNSSETKGIPIVILIQYGHATRNGGYVAPNDFINPVTKEVYDQLIDEIGKELSKQ
jgi:hypothetical protein